ncbi:MAR-binding filament-like protein 1-1 isoform X2 [Cajanus cajan]|uniref:MAR-binding filament-like protein 1-1 isoform X2 n=1 Tax=Cajanus cajan TaxID=3821 RepID=UPI00098DA1BF|nr:MAR-binding filament-like protein 1-1 isoform X2 [Cajanus cajan]
MGFVASSFCSLYKFPSSSNGPTPKAKFRAPTTSCLGHHDPICNKRTFLLTTIALLPFRRLKRAPALEPPPSKVTEVKTREDDQEAETAPEVDKPSNSPLPLLNGIGIFSSGVLGALYTLAQKEKASAIATIETMSIKLKEKEELIVSLKKNYEFKLLNKQEEQAKLLEKAKEEQQALINELNSAKSTINRLEQELKNERNLIEDLKLQIDRLETELSKTDTDKKDLENNLKEKIDSIGILEERISQLSVILKDKEDLVQNLNSSLAKKELELKSLNSTYMQTKDDLSNVRLQIQGLKEEILKSQEELKTKDSQVIELNSRVSSLTLENNDFRSKYDAMEKEYNDLKVTAEKKAALDSKVLREKEEEFHQLKDQFELALSEASKNQITIANLSQERDDLKEALENESGKVNHLKYELLVTQENLEKSRDGSTELENLLNESNKLRKELELEVSKLSSEFTEVKVSLQRSLDDAKHEAEMLANDLTTAKEQLKKAQAEFQSKSQELTAALEKCDSLQKELIDVYKKAETTAEDLKKEKQLVASLNKDLQALEKQVSVDKDSRKSLEMDLEEATKSLDEMNGNALILADELGRANSLISSLEKEKEVLSKSLIDQRNANKKAQDNIEDAHNLIMKLGKERENLENKGKRLEEELASAKGEILRLKSRISSSKVVVNNEQVQKDEGLNKVNSSNVADNNKQVQKDEGVNKANSSKVGANNEQVQKDEGENKVTVNARRTVRRKKANPQ